MPRNNQGFAGKSLIGQVKLSQSETQYLAMALRGIANDVVVRGFQSRDLNTLIDGQRIYGACPNRMDPAVFHVDFAEVDRVEIGRGPFDIRNQGSMGGTVNIITRKPSSGFHSSGNNSGGSYGYINPSGLNLNKSCHDPATDHDSSSTALPANEGAPLPAKCMFAATGPIGLTLLAHYPPLGTGSEVRG
jgi:hypothetical protein